MPKREIVSAGTTLAELQALLEPDLTLRIACHATSRTVSLTRPDHPGELAFSLISPRTRTLADQLNEALCYVRPDLT